MKLTKRNVDDVYRLDFGYGTAPIFLSEEEMDGLRGGFQTERDEQLGRWRDPENPDMVCYPVECDPNAVWVVYEGDGRRYHATRTGWELTRPHYASEAAGRYFQAHPDPNPWRAAQPDEVWVLTDGDRSEVFRCGENGLYSLKTGDPISRVFPIITVTAGRRIWPDPNGAENPNSSGAGQ